jgi:hypothetical protein
MSILAMMRAAREGEAAREFVQRLYAKVDAEHNELKRKLEVAQREMEDRPDIDHTARWRLRMRWPPIMRDIDLKLDELAAYTDYSLTAAIMRQEAELEESEEETGKGDTEQDIEDDAAREAACEGGADNDSAQSRS